MKPGKINSYKTLSDIEINNKKLVRSEKKQRFLNLFTKLKLGLFLKCS